MTRVVLLVPAYNEATVIADVLRSYRRVKRQLAPQIRLEILVINDGSTDTTAEIARHAKVRVVSHLLNLGLGGAISTGLRIAKEEGFDAAVTADSDGQHQAADVKRAIEAISKGRADFIVGSRWLKKAEDVPIHRMIGNKYVMNTLTLFFTGTRTSDSQSGLRGFSRRAIEKINLVPQRMEVSTELFAQVRLHRLRYQEIPIAVIYTDYSMTKGQRSVNGFSIVWRLLVSRIVG